MRDNQFVLTSSLSSPGPLNECGAPVPSSSALSLPSTMSTSTASASPSVFNSLTNLLNSHLGNSSFSSDKNAFLSQSDRSGSCDTNGDSRQSPSFFHASKSFPDFSAVDAPLTNGKRDDSGIKIKLKNPRKPNGKATGQDGSGDSPTNKNAPKLTNGLVNGIHDESGEKIKKHRRKKEDKKDKPPRKPAAPRKMKRATSTPNGDGDSPGPAPKKSRVARAAGEMRDASTGTCSAETMTEHHLIGPLEPGTPVTLEGIVWHESVVKGFVVVNITWRGKNYMGTLMDDAQLEWTPPRHCDSPPSDVDLAIRSPVKDKVKRARNGTETDLTALAQLRGGKTRRGANFQTPASPARSDVSGTGPQGKRKGRVPNSLKTGPAPDVNFDVSSPSPTETDGKPKRGRRVASGGSTPMAETAPPLVSPTLVECSEAGCSKKFKDAISLRYHLQAAHQARPENGDSSREADSSLSKSDLGSLLALDLPLNPFKTDSVDSATRPKSGSINGVASPSATDKAKPTALPNLAGEATDFASAPFGNALKAALENGAFHSATASEEESRSADKIRNATKQRRKQLNPTSSQAKDNSSSAVDNSVVIKEPPVDLSKTELPLLQTPPLAKLDAQLQKDPKPKTGPSSAIGSTTPALPTPLIPLPAAFAPSTSRSCKDKSSLVDLTGPCLPLSPADLTFRNLPIDLKVNAAAVPSPLQDLKSPSNGRGSPVYSDISDDSSDDKPEKESGDLTSLQVPISTAPVPDKAGSYFNFFPPPPFLIDAAIEAGRKSGSPAEQAKNVIIPPFPQFFGGAAPSPFFPGLAPEIKVDPDAKSIPAEGSSKVSRPVESKNPKDVQDTSRSDKPCTPSTKESPSASKAADSKPVPPRDDKAKGPLKDQNKLLPSQPRMYTQPPFISHNVFRPAMPPNMFAPGHPMSFYGPRPPMMTHPDQAHFLEAMMHYGFGPGGPGRPGPMPPAMMPHLTPQEHISLEAIQCPAAELARQGRMRTRTSEPGFWSFGISGMVSASEPKSSDGSATRLTNGGGGQLLPHKVHELVSEYPKNGPAPPSGSSSGGIIPPPTSSENRKPCTPTPPVPNKKPSSSDNPSKSSASTSGESERSCKSSKPDRTSGSPLHQRTPSHSIHPAMSLAPPLVQGSHIDPYLYAPQRNPLHLPSINPN